MFALLAFVGSIALGVYVLYYQKHKSDDDSSDSSAAKVGYHYRSPTAPMHMAPPRPDYRAPPQAAPSAYPALAQPPAGPTQPYHLASATYNAAPAIPPTVPSGVVGTFFD